MLFCRCSHKYIIIHSLVLQCLHKYIIYTFINDTVLQVFTRLHKLHLCLTHASLLRVLDEAAEGHDELVIGWQYTQEQNAISLKNSLVSLHVVQIVQLQSIHVMYSLSSQKIKRYVSLNARKVLTKPYLQPLWLWTQ